MIEPESHIPNVIFSSLPSTGINLEKDILLYADWDFFSRRITGNTNIAVTLIPNILTVGRDGTKSLERLVYKHLKSSQSFKGCLFPMGASPLGRIEGEDIGLYLMVEAKENPKIYPLLLKIKGLELPLEFFDHINSRLTVYGEFIPVPFTVFNMRYGMALFAKAIAYFEKD